MYAFNNSVPYDQYLGGLPPLTSTQNKMILSQLEKTICKIQKLNGIIATGFLCRIPFPNNSRLLPVLITNNHVLNKEDIQLYKTVRVTIGDDKIEKYIKLDESRMVYTSSDLNIDVTIIEIKPKIDGFKHFLDVDENIFTTNYIEVYQRKPVYILQYPKGKESSHSEGIISNINNKNIEHTCSVDICSSGAPILKLSTFKVIGVHKRMTGSNFNEGTLIKFIINYFYDKFQNERPQNYYNQINYPYHNNNNYYNNQEAKKGFTGNNMQYVNNPNTYNYPQNKLNHSFNGNLKYPQPINNYYPPKNNYNPPNNYYNPPNNNYNPPNNNYNPQKNNYYPSNNLEIIKDNNSKEYNINSYGGIVKSYAFCEYQVIKNKNNINYKTIENFNGDKNKILFSIFNGHGGNHVSKYLQENIGNYMKKILPFRDISMDFTNLFRALDEKIKELNIPDSGSTGTVVYIENNYGKKRLFCANVGNNRCLLINRKGVLKLTNDHNINDPEEHKRIIRKGGILNMNQLFGKYTSSRSFGHWSIKKYGGIISDPHITIIDLNDDDFYLIIGSEKVWKYLRDEECLKFVENKIPLEISRKICIELQNRGCSFNVGALVISLK